jgi:hypothetical protein
LVAWEKDFISCVRAGRICNLHAILIHSRIELHLRRHKLLAELDANLGTEDGSRIAIGSLYIMRRYAWYPYDYISQYTLHPPQTDVVEADRCWLIVPAQVRQDVPSKTLWTRLPTPASFSSVESFHPRHDRLPSDYILVRSCITHIILHLHQTHHRSPQSEPGAMRYQDWDILLYPKGCDVPFREFKTACYAVQDDSGGGVTGGNGMFATTRLSTLTEA